MTYRVRGGKRCSTFLSKKAFAAVDLEERKQAASEVEIVEVYEEEETAVVRSSDETQFYSVRLSHPHPRFRCDCAIGRGELKLQDSEIKAVIAEFQLESTRDIPVTQYDQIIAKMRAFAASF